MKHYIKIFLWVICAILLLGVCVVGGILLKSYLYDKMNPVYEVTSIYPDNESNPTDTVLAVNGVEIGMIGIRSGKICCQGFRDTISLKDFYISDTEVTQKLWTLIMEENPSINQECDSLPVENVDLVDCLKFVHRLDSITGLDIYIPSYPQWLYAANIGQCDSNLHSSDKTLDDIAWWKDDSQNRTHPVKQKEPNSLGIYDMTGNVAEWTVSGSDPLFYVMGGSYESDIEHCKFDFYEIDYANVRIGTIGLRLVYYPESNTLEK